MTWHQEVRQCTYVDADGVPGLVIVDDSLQVLVQAPLPLPQLPTSHTDTATACPCRCHC